MSLYERLIEDFEELPKIRNREGIDFVEFLKQKNHKRLEEMMDETIFENKDALEELAK